MKIVRGIFIVLVLGLAFLTWRYFDGRGGGERSLMVFCAAGIKKPVAEIAERYREEFGVEVALQYGGTGTLLSQLKLAKRGDLFIAADSGAVADATRLGVIDEVVPLCVQYPVVAVAAGNPKGIGELEDLWREGVRVAVANPEAASIGKSTKAVFGERWGAFKEKVAVMKPTVTELAADLSLGAIDAAVVWNSTVPQFEGLEAVELVEFSARKENVSAAVLRASEQVPEALKFARYLVAPERGGPVFRDKGFEVVEGDEWEESQRMVLYSGGVNRPAIEKTLAEFAEREGAEVTTVFNGCGILCASMQAMEDTRNPQYPDAYFACDLCFVPPVAGVFPETVLLTETEIGIVVQKGNPKAVKTLADLAEEGMKVGLCNADQSTLGFMTQGMLTSTVLEKAVRKNVVVEVPTADFLINQMRVGALDAAIVYRVNYDLQKEHLEFLKIEHEGARAVQPFAVRADSKKRQLSGRLLEFLKKNRERFEETGFTWVGDQPPIKSADIELPPWLKETVEAGEGGAGN